MVTRSMVIETVRKRIVSPSWKANTQKLMRTVREKKEITDEVKTAMTTVLAEFKNTFKPIKDM
jgi:hypothetical protein